MGANFWNSGEFYGEAGHRTGNLSLLKRYFTQYPEDANNVVLSIKGGVNTKISKPDGSAAGIKKSIENILSYLDGKKLDVFECARVDRTVPIEETIAAIAEFVKAGKIGGIGLSEVSANSIRRAHAVHPIACVEVEFSLFSTEILTNGVSEACAELGIPIIAYSPLSQGFLSGQIRSRDDIPDGELRKSLDRFQPGNFEKNLKLAGEINKIATQKGVTLAQLALAWIRYQSGRDGMPVIIPIPGATKESRVIENMAHVEVTDDEVAAIGSILSSMEVAGGRYTEELRGGLLV